MLIIFSGLIFAQQDTVKIKNKLVELDKKFIQVKKIYQSTDSLQIGRLYYMNELRKEYLQSFNALKKIRKGKKK